ncbi:MAG TPA: endonuclease/exonuclease/phosphatase family protein [Planctomycetota bacterium]|nr:endonuclease/exonuclease/phosphatase family protein [Planctomycetota bacterium]
MMQPTSRPFRLLNWNVHHCVGIDRKHSVERVADAILELEPDVVALQELEVNHKRSQRIDQPRRIAELLDMDYHYHPARVTGGAGFGNAVFTRHAMREVRTAHLPTFRFLQKRGAVWMSVELDGHSVQIINTHFGLMRLERLMQARALCGNDWLDHPECRENPRIVCGDFNATPMSRVYKLLDSTLKDAMKLAGDPRVRTWPSMLPIVRYDHVFVCDGIRARRAEVPKTPRTRIASDHLPVLVDFEVRSRAKKSS